MFNVTMLEGKITNVAHHDAIQHNWQWGGQDLRSQSVASSLNLNNSIHGNLDVLFFILWWQNHIRQGYSTSPSDYPCHTIWKNDLANIVKWRCDLRTPHNYNKKVICIKGLKQGCSFIQNNKWQFICFAWTLI
jgi:hypothetical protein